MQLFLLILFVRVRLVFIGFRIFVPLLVPLVVVKVIAHLSDCLGCWSLIFDWHPSKSGVDIEFDVIALEDVLVVIVDFHIFVACYSLIVITSQRPLLSLLGLLKLFSHPVCSFFWIVNFCLFFLFFLLFSSLWRRRRFCSYFYVVGGKEPLLIWLLN